MAKKHKCPECPPPGSPAWMSTYSDMVTLLLTFFVLMLSMANMEEQKFTMAMTSLRGALGLLNSSAGAAIPITTMPMFQVGKGQVEQTVEQILEQMDIDLKQTGMQDMLRIDKTKDRLHFTIAEPMLFDSGRADIKAGADSLLRVISNILALVPFEIRIEGHTDNIPIHTVRFPSNWELSCGRAIALAQRFQVHGIAPSRFQIIGYGEHRPIADNVTDVGRRLNRRTEIFVNLRDEVRQSILPGSQIN